MNHKYPKMKLGNKVDEKTRYLIWDQVSSQVWDQIESGICYRTMNETQNRIMTELWGPVLGRILDQLL